MKRPLEIAETQKAIKDNIEHLCPLPGHGSTRIISASPTTSINFLGAARVGDVTGCGAVITTGFPSVLVGDRPMAYLGSRTNHGGMVTTGSADTLGGFKVGGGAISMAIVDYAKLGVMLPDNTMCLTRLAKLSADPCLMEKAIAAFAIVDPNAVDKTPIPQLVCAHPDRLQEVANYMAEEMNRNILEPAVAEMKRLNALDIQAERDKFYAMPWYARLAPPNFEGLALGSTAAGFTLWAEKVGQNRPWDHKPVLLKNFPKRWIKHGEFEYNFDIWSNLHYGYIGVIAGFSEDVLLEGAGLEQIGSDSIRKIRDWDSRPGPSQKPGAEGLRAWDDAPDQVSILMGIKLAARYSEGAIKAKSLMDEVISLGAGWGDAIRPHGCL